MSQHLCPVCGQYTDEPVKIDDRYWEEKCQTMEEALRNISQAKHRPGCPEDGEDRYYGYCNCPEEIARIALNKQEKQNGR